ncbi:hypothetical protein Misp06_00500 [Microbulbifer sp. NBRC 101763]|uniref:hypothetical protein n=1 Tax=Microbulbifer TaxID=48073 RepID=UPI00036C8B7E|nr:MULTISPECIES: hypothetical protein [Microbulbifer]WHI49726.1 hypothetical protein P3339_14750 [Microbulbifer sp. MLAF003]
MKHFLVVVFIIFANFTMAEGMLGIPESFLGKWGGSKDSCSAQFPLDVLSIEEKRIIFWESSGKPKLIMFENDELELTLHMVGEGEEWLSEEVYYLDASSQVLTRRTKNGMFQYHKCTS